MRATLVVLRVFVGADGRGGTPVGVFLDPEPVAERDRQAVAAELGFSETVFVVDPTRGVMRVHTPEAELPFAGCSVVGTAWLMADREAGLDVLRPPAGEVPTWEEDERRWIRGRAAWAPTMQLQQLPDPAAVEAQVGGIDGEGFTYSWSWIDEAAGTVRSRAFPTALGISEDEATGAAAMRLSERLARAVTIWQGVGSQLLARPGPDGSIEVGGRVVLVDERPWPPWSIRFGSRGIDGRRPGAG